MDLRKIILDKQPDVDLDEEIEKLTDKLPNLSEQGALSIIANRLKIKTAQDRPKAQLKTINTLKENDDNVEIAGTIINAYPIKFFNICPSCAKSVKEISGVYKCEKHGVVTPAYSYLVNVIIDDGEQVRATLFSRSLEKLLGMDTSQIIKIKDNQIKTEELQSEMLGKLVSFRGKVKKNDMSQRLEFTVNMVFKEPKDVLPRVEAISSLVKNQKIIANNDEEEQIEEERIV